MRKVEMTHWFYVIDIHKFTERFILNDLSDRLEVIRVS